LQRAGKRGERSKLQAGIRSQEGEGAVGGAEVEAKGCLANPGGLHLVYYFAPTSCDVLGLGRGFALVGKIALVGNKFRDAQFE
jgi:hypothetical protein